MECVLDMGLNGIVADDPGRLRDVAVIRGRKPHDPRAALKSTAQH